MEIFEDHEELVDVIMSDTLESQNEFLISQLRAKQDEVVYFHNNNISKGVNYFKRKGMWSNLSRLLRQLPDDILETKKSSLARKTVDVFAKQVKEFMSLSKKDRERALASLEKSEINPSKRKE
jgi:hypothetical protein